MAVLTPLPPADTRATSSRIPPVPPLPPLHDEDGNGEGKGRAPMRRVELPPDRLKMRLVVALCVSLLANLAFYNQAAVWGKQIRVVFLQALHQQYVPPPAQIILVTPHRAARPGGKTTYTPLAPLPHASASPSPSPTPQQVR